MKERNEIGLQILKGEITARKASEEYGIGTSATRAEIIKKLERINYISINTKTQIITPTEKRRKNI